MGTLPWCGLLLTLLMGGASPPDPPTAPFESGMPRLALQSEILLMGTLARYRLLLTLVMGVVLSLDLAIIPFEFGMPKLVLWLASLLQGIKAA